MPSRKAAPKKTSPKKKKKPQDEGNKSKLSSNQGSKFYCKKKNGNWRGDRGRNAKKY